MQDKHGLAKQDLGMEGTRAIGREQIAQVEREVGIGNTVPVGRARRQGQIAPALILGCLKKEKIDSIRRSRADVDAIRRLRGNGDVAAENSGQIGHAVLQKILQDSSHGGDGERRAHRVPSFRDLR